MTTLRYLSFKIFPCYNKRIQVFQIEGLRADSLGILQARLRVCQCQDLEFTSFKYSGLRPPTHLAKTMPAPQEPSLPLPLALPFTAPSLEVAGVERQEKEMGVGVGGVGVLE